jgi:hypothetical protein
LIRKSKEPATELEGKPACLGCCVSHHDAKDQTDKAPPDDEKMLGIFLYL